MGEIRPKECEPRELTKDQLQEGEWAEQPLAPWEWRLRADCANSLEVRVRNSAGVLGPVSRVVLQQP